MREIRIHGRGGQGAVTAATLLADAIFRENQWTQMIPDFGDERRGAPVKAFVRIDDKPIRTASEFIRPDCVVVLDPVLPTVVDVERGMKEGGILVLNDKRPPQEIKTNMKLSKIATVDATGIAIEIFGRTAISITNTAMAGAFSAATGWAKLSSILDAVKERFMGKMLESNVDAVKKGYERTRVMTS